MIARCAQCRETFSTERFGRQACPLCGAEVYVAKPGETPPPAGAPPASPPPEGGPALPPVGGGEAPPAGGSPQDEPAPFDARGFRAYFETLKLALFEPSKLFGPMRVDTTGRALLFGWVTLTVPTLIGVLLTRALFPTDLTELLQLQGKVPSEYRDLLKNLSTGSTTATLLLTPVLSLVWLYAVAGVVHLMLLLLSQNRRGFNATFRAVCYAAAPDVFSAIPQCGSIVAFFWMIGLTAYGLSHTQRISPGSAAAAVLAPLGAVCCGACACSAAVLALLGAAGTGTP